MERLQPIRLVGCASHSIGPRSSPRRAITTSRPAWLCRSGAHAGVLAAAVQRSVAIVRTFVRMRELRESNREIAARKVEKLERGHYRTASVIEMLVGDIDRLAREVIEDD
jgi:hypothetical protein